jgi:WG containing repeat
MMRLPVLFLLVFASFFASADPYILYKEKDKIGIKDDAGKVIIPAAFEAIGWSDGSFSVISGVTGYKLNDQWGLINLKKEFLAKPDYESIVCFGGDRVVARKKINSIQSATGCLNLKGEVTVPFIYSGINIIGLRAIVFVKKIKSYESGLIDLNGKEIIPVKYASIRPLGTLRYAVENDKGKTAVYADDGKQVTDFTIDSIATFHSSVAVFYQNKKQGLISREGEIKLAAVYRGVKIESDGSILVKMPDEWRVLSGDNKEIRKIDADQLIPLRKDLYHIVQGKAHGVVDRAFNVVLPPDYTYLDSLKNNKLIAEKNGKYGVIRLNGSEVIPFKYDSLILAGRMARVRTDIQGKSAWSLVDTFGIRKTQKEFDFLGAFNGQFYPAEKNGYSGGVDRYGQLIIQCVFDSLLQVKGNKVAVKFRGQYGVIDTSEKWIVTPQPLKITLRTPERYSIVRDDVVFIRDLSGNDIYFSGNQLVFHDDYVLEISPDGAEKRINYDGRIIERSAPPVMERTEKVFPESEGLRGILKDGKYGFVDARGRLRIANRYDGIGAFQEGLAAVKILGKWGYVDVSERIVVQPVYDIANPFNNGLAQVSRAGKTGIIEKDGRALIPMKYDSIGRLPDGNFLLKLNSLYGLADRSGQVRLDTRNDRITDLDNGYVLISRNGKSGLLTTQGLSTIPLAYDKLLFDKDKNEYLGLMTSSWRKITVN